jgi:CRISPR/Cas system-associated exonuclease Cas4 (RecB family)
MIDERIRPLFPKGDTASHAVLAAVVDEWRRYHEVVTHAGGGASLDEFRTHYLRENTTRRRGGNKVRLLSARESSGRMFQMAFVCGCAEGYFPGAGVQDGYISMAALARALEAADREAAADLAARVDETEVERTEHALFLTALTRARDALVLLAPAKIGGESTLPARVLEAAAPPFARDAGTRTPSPCARAAQAVAIASPDRALVDRLRPLDVLAAWWTSPPALERFPALGEFSMSASKLNSYARCARQFFYRNVLKLDEPESIYLRVGSLVHDALKEIIPEGATRDEIRAALRNARAREIAERLVGEAMREEGVWMRELSVKYLEDMLAHVAELEALREGDYRVLKREEEVKADIGGMPLRGRMDRVDEVEGLGPLIIDYKTSGSINKTYTTLVEKLETDYWQIPVYAAMAAANDLAPGGFVYYALPPGEESFAAGVQLAPGRRPAPIPLGRSRSQARYGPVEAATVAAAMARAVEIHRTIIEGECRYERTEDTGICPNCHFAAICQRSRASL